MIKNCFLKDYIMTKIFMLVLLLFFSTATIGQTSSDFSGLNNGKKWNVGYIEGGEHYNYSHIFKFFIMELMGDGLIEISRLPEDIQSKELWDLLSSGAIKSDFLSFTPENFYSGSWINEKNDFDAQTIINRANNGDIDIIISAGTKAGKSVANDTHSTPVLSMGASNALLSGILKTQNSSGYDHVFATLFLGKYENHIKIFHEVVGFNNLGVIYENTKNGRSYSGIDVIEEISKERDFNITSCILVDESIDVEEVREYLFLNCVRKLIYSGVDAIYLSEQGGSNEKIMATVARIAIEERIPTFSQLGYVHVKKGILIGSSSFDNFKIEANYVARAFKNVLLGIKPNNIPNVITPAATVSINRFTANKINYKIPTVLRGAATTIFNDIEEGN
jgi:ABC-type uncharacterized transport system substrate-binding protein